MSSISPGCKSCVTPDINERKSARLLWAPRKRPHWTQQPMRRWATSAPSSRSIPKPCHGSNDTLGILVQKGLGQDLSPYQFDKGLPHDPFSSPCKGSSASLCESISALTRGTTMPNLTACMALDISVRVSPLLSTVLRIPFRLSRVHRIGLIQNGLGGVLLNAPSPLGDSPIFLQGRVRST
jgi:hypothetical protein